MPFESLKISQGPGPLFQIELLRSGRITPLDVTPLAHRHHIEHSTLTLVTRRRIERLRSDLDPGVYADATSNA